MLHGVLALGLSVHPFSGHLFLVTFQGFDVYAVIPIAKVPFFRYSSLLLSTPKNSLSFYGVWYEFLDSYATLGAMSNRLLACR